MMVTVLLYAYSTGTYSSRRMAAKLEDDVAFRFLAAGNTPDFRTLSDFRKTHGVALNGLFVQVLKLCAEAGLVKLGRMAVDGTKMKANASKHKAMSYARMSEREAALQCQVAELLARGFRQFLRRGVERVSQEWSLICTAHNLLKLRAAWRTR